MCRVTPLPNGYAHLFDYRHLPKNYFEKKRDEFLASVMTENFSETGRILTDLLDRIESAAAFSEVEQKAINQILHAGRRFRGQLCKNTDNSQHIFARIRKRMARYAVGQIRSPAYVEYDAWLKTTGLDEKQFRTMLRTVSTLQLTVGCSVCCRRCNEWALPGPRKHFSFDAVKQFIRGLAEAGNTGFVLYCASDPLDWRCGDRNILDILAFMSERGYESRYGLLTKIPAGSGETARAALRMGLDIGFSITDRNRPKVEDLKKEFGTRVEVQHDFDTLLIPAGLDEDFSSIKSSITDHYGTEITPEGAFMTIPTFTSALNPTGQRRIPVTGATDFFLKKKVGRDALPVVYFKPLEVIDLERRRFMLGGLFEAQIENILLDNGSEDLTPPGMMNLREYFKTYGPDAVERRKALVPAVVKQLGREVLDQEPSGERPGKASCIRLKQRIRRYHESCDMENVIRYKKSAFSYYLRTVSQYLRTHGEEREIIRFLRKSDQERYRPDEAFRMCNDADYIETRLQEESGNGHFDLFEILICKLIEDPDHNAVKTFIEKHPVQSTDGFL